MQHMPALRKFDKNRLFGSGYPALPVDAEALIYNSHPLKQFLIKNAIPLTFTLITIFLITLAMSFLFNQGVDPATGTPLSLPPLISEREIDKPRPLKVIYIGAGVSGIIGAIQFQKKLQNLELVIYEKNPDVGGTWYENRYPGCACGNLVVKVL